MRLYVFISIIVGMMIVLNLAGINTTTGYILSKLDIVDNPQDLEGTALLIAIGVVFTLAVPGGLVIGFFTKTSPESYLIAPLAVIFIIFIGDIISVINYSRSTFGTGNWGAILIATIMGAVAIGYAITVVDWWRGTA